MYNFEKGCVIVVCKKCGTEFSGKFCPSCGAKQSKLSKKQIIIIVCAVLAIGIIGGIGANIKMNTDIKEAVSYINSGDFEKAKDALDSQLKTNGSQSKLYLTYADYYLAQKDYSNAIDILEKGLKRCSSKDSIQEKLDAINKDYGNEIAAQEKAKQEAEQKEAEAAAKEEAQRKKEEEKQQKKSKEDYIASCQEIGYNDLARNPDKYKGQAFKFTGEVIQVVEPTFGETVTLRIDVTKTEYDFYTDTIYATVTVPDGSDRILKDDIITIYGDCEGLYSYESVLGQKISLPKIRIKYYSVKN